MGTINITLNIEETNALAKFLYAKDDDNEMSWLREELEIAIHVYNQEEYESSMAEG